MTDVAERLWTTMEPYLEAEGVELDDLAVTGRSGGRIVRVTVDADEGVGVDRIAALSRGLARLLDESDPIQGAYTLEVSSPGLERELRRPSHFSKAVGSEVSVTTREPVDGSTTHKGILDGATEGDLTIRVDDAVRTIPLGSVARARTVYRWDGAPKPGRK